ncbi:glycoside hydrolase family 16 protein [Rheinheimera baltica]|uniref:glycoside hydrolase family 16 protein n=1 Tax=Rheinheimera baltica TaxID=67576 RepID=UPI00273CFC5C|nr:glycoside hydrolase family 16 protein [Rheinheimera baltica]MDP5143686.1 glycoside hydrolase family 16 protein [Rheinheimera baltica]
MRYSSFAVLLLLGGCGPATVTNSNQTAAMPDQTGLMFDDFNYTSAEALFANGWTARTETGHPGIAAATWSAEGISVHPAPEQAQFGIARMSSVTDGSGAGTRHTQICHARKYLYGTYAARVFFRNEPTYGADGDEVIQTFYAISPLAAPLDPDYSEVDFEYLPNGGWGENSDSAMWTTTWETFQLEPWTKVNEFSRVPGDYAGWHTLVMNVTSESVRYYVDGSEIGEHSAAVAPEVPMSMNFNLWFMPKGADGSVGPINSAEPRQYQQDIDWVLHVEDQLLNTAEVEAKVAALRAGGQHAVDEVADKGLAAYCGL